MNLKFDECGFMEWLENTFNGFENSFFRGTVENIVTYGLEHKCTSKEQLCNWLSEMLSEVEFDEVAMFVLN